MRRLRRGALARVEVEIVTWTLCTASRLLVSWLAIPAALSATEHAMPWSDAGLSERQAASHLIDRFTFGATPGLVDQVVAQGLEEWLARQLSADSRSGDLDAKLAALATLELTNDQIVRDYPRPGRLRREAIEAGRLDPKLDGEDQRRLLRQYAQEMGYKPQRQIVGELVAQRLFRAVHSPNQVAEVMVDFWFNHLYVSATDNQCRRFIGTYERDVVRAYVFERFVEMLRASAKHPAMLLYLDNALSSAPEHVATRVTVAKAELRQQPGRAGLRYDEMFERMERNEAKRQRRMEEIPEERRPRRGVNENYARELLELHTLGVDGGYTQRDVEEIARALTGWTVLPDGERRPRIRERLQRPLAAELGFLLDGDFLFAADRHDAEAKQVLGRASPPGRGIEEGEEILDMLGRHPSTARHLARKLAVRFVRDDPPASLVERLAAVFEASGGDLREMVWALVACPEFWDESARRAKVKSPYELAASSVRALGADVMRPRQLARWVDRMGQPLYRYQAPTGFPDRATAWVDAGALLQRMNFGMSLAAGRVPGVRVDIARALGGREPESADAALVEYARALLPGRDVEPTLDALRPLLGQPQIAAEIDRRAAAAEQEARSRASADSMRPQMEGMAEETLIDPLDLEEENRLGAGEPEPAALTLTQVVGLILGSPEFQRR
jgi:uncharacterized protein (DUF1800 family)